MTSNTILYVQCHTTKFDNIISILQMILFSFLYLSKTEYILNFWMTYVHQSSVIFKQVTFWITFYTTSQMFKFTLLNLSFLLS